MNSCVSHLSAYIEDHDYLLVSTYKEWQILIEEFIKAFADNGIKLVIFFDGLPVERRQELYLLRAKDRQEHIFQTFDLLYEGNHETASQASCIMPLNLYNVIPLTSVSSKDCNCYCAIEEADEEIARYAKTNKCFGVLAQDSDFVIFEGAQYYFSVKHFDLDSLTTVAYSRSELANKLLIDMPQLPLLATLCGNDIVNFDELHDFHRYVSGWNGDRIPFNIIFQSVATYIRNLPLGKDILNHLRRISLDAFGNEHMAEKLKLSLLGYWIEDSTDNSEVLEKKNETNWDKILKLAKERHINYIARSHIYEVLLEKDVYLAMRYEDTRNWKLKPSSEVLEVLRKRMYGLLLKEKEIDQEQKHVKEWHLNSNTIIHEPKRITPIFPDDHPGLLQLWNTADQNLETKKMRWRCFCEAVSKLLNYEEIMKLKHDLVIPVLALFYLTHETNKAILEPWEIEAFLAQAVLVNKSPLKDMINRKAEFCDDRIVYLATLFEITCECLGTLSEVCGDPIAKLKASIVNFYHGKTLASIYRQCKDGVPGEKLCGNAKSQVDAYKWCLSIVHNHCVPKQNNKKKANRNKNKSKKQ